MKKILLVATLFLTGAPALATPNWLPPGCSVESWCLVKATACFVGHVTNPQGLYQGHSQYSVVRKVSALCRDEWGYLVRRTVVGPVEPVPFTSSVETTEARARESALELCNVYRRDWVDVAPSCTP